MVQQLVKSHFKNIYEYYSYSDTKHDSLFPEFYITSPCDGVSLLWCEHARSKHELGFKIYKRFKKNDFVHSIWIKMNRNIDEVVKYWF